MDKHTYFLRYIPMGYADLPRFEMIRVQKQDDLWKVARGLLMFSHGVEIIRLSDFVREEKK